MAAARPKSLRATRVRPQLHQLALEALARYSASGLVMPGDRMFRQLVAYNQRMTCEPHEDRRLRLL